VEDKQIQQWKLHHNNRTWFYFYYCYYFFKILKVRDIICLGKISSNAKLGQRMKSWIVLIFVLSVHHRNYSKTNLQSIKEASL